MLPSRVIYIDKLYDTVGFIKLNNGSFLILKNADDLISVDLSKASGLSLKLKFEVKEATKVETIFIDYVVQALKNDIKNGKYKEKRFLMDDIKEINKYINTHPEFLANMKELDFKDDLVIQNLPQLLSYFDEVMAPSPLNLENISSFEVGDKDYIKFKDENGNVKILDDSHDNRSVSEQFESKQDESSSFQTSDASKNALEIANDTLKFDKKEVPLEGVGLDNSIISTQPILAGDSISVNEEEKILYNQTDDKIITLDSNGLEFKEVGETTNGIETQDNFSQVVYPPYDETIVTLLLLKGNDINVDTIINKYLNDLTVEQIDILMNSYQLNPEQIAKLTEQKNIKTSSFVSDEENIEAKQLIKKPDKAAFVDSLLLSFIVGSICGIYLTFLMMNVLV